MAREEVQINLVHLLIALAAGIAIVAASIALLPEEFIDYGILSALLVWTGYLLVSQWNTPPLRRALYICVALAFLAGATLLLWPLNYPM